MTHLQLFSYLPGMPLANESNKGLGNPGPSHSGSSLRQEQPSLVDGMCSTAGKTCKKALKISVTNST